MAGTRSLWNVSPFQFLKAVPFDRVSERRDKRVERETESLESGVNCFIDSFEQPVKTSPQFSQSGKTGDINSLGFDTWCWYFLTRDRSPTKPGSRVLFFEMAEEIIRKKTNFWPILCYSMENLWRREWSIFFEQSFGGKNLFLTRVFTYMINVSRYTREFDSIDPFYYF